MGSYAISMRVSIKAAHSAVFAVGMIVHDNLQGIANLKEALLLR